MGDDITPVGAPREMLIAAGWLAQFLLVVPQWNLTVVTLGMTMGMSHWCDADAANYDEPWSMTQLWQALGNRMRRPVDSRRGRER